MRRALAAAIALNAGAAIPWWILLLVSTESRRWFLPAAFPDAALLAFGIGDALLYIGAGLLAALGLWRGSRWAHSVLLLHTGACCYGSLYTIHQWLLTGEASLAALAMLPSLILLPYACWTTRR